jgi:hypothetical protein
VLRPPIRVGIAVIISACALVSLAASGAHSGAPAKWAKTIDATIGDTTVVTFERAARNGYCQVTLINPSSSRLPSRELRADLATCSTRNGPAVLAPQIDIAVGVRATKSTPGFLSGRLGDRAVAVDGSRNDGRSSAGVVQGRSFVLVFDGAPPQTVTAMSADGQPVGRCSVSWQSRLLALSACV